TSLVGIFGVSACLEGYAIANMNWIQRILSLAAGIMLIDPSVATDIIGISLLVVVLIWQFFQIKKNKPINA
ncbi:MAG: C4-dicarboxylate ABC transporter permease, partial [Clostridia bacterium]|nr:C4-dicarboxylate ABC transporter permease [Clostridia bacterium]